MKISHFFFILLQPNFEKNEAINNYQLFCNFADWYVDNMGRLGVENLSGEKPGKEDIEKFQIELDKALRKMMGR